MGLRVEGFREAPQPREFAPGCVHHARRTDIDFLGDKSRLVVSASDRWFSSTATWKAAPSPICCTSDLTTEASPTVLGIGR